MFGQKNPIFLQTSAMFPLIIIYRHKAQLCNGEIFPITIEDTAYTQIETVCNEPAFKESEIRIMPDVHAGKGCTIGTTMTIIDKIH